VDADVVYATRWTRHGLVDLRLDLYRPADERVPSGGWPLVVWMHGGGWVQGSKSYCPLTWLTEHGYAVASIEYRFTQEAAWPASIADCHAAVDWLMGHGGDYQLDARRVVLSGGSSGAHLAALAGVGRDVAALGGGVNQWPAVRGIASYFAPADLTLFGEIGYASEHTRFFTEMLLGGPLEQMAEAAKQASVSTHVDAGDPPMLIVHGSADPLLQPELARRMHATCQRVGVPSELVILEGADHGNPRDVFFTGEQARQRLLGFLVRHMDQV
jgi:acetyl esterase/lipase